MTDEQKQKIQEARAHLAVALVQVHPSDDQIIVGHMREAQAALDAALYPNPKDRKTFTEEFRAIAIDYADRKATKQ